jgi:hypothetical protein
MNDLRILRDLARQYADVAAKPVQEQRRELWSDHNSLRPARVLVIATYGMWNVWCREVFGDAQMQCADPFYRQYERELRLALFHDTFGDDFILEPWINVGAVHKVDWNNLWGVALQKESLEVEGGAWHFDPVIRD